MKQGHVFRRLLLWGMLAGVCGGLLAAGFAAVAGEPSIDRAIAYEEGKVAPEHEHDAGRTGEEHSHARAESHSHGEGEALVARGVQKRLGLPLAAALYGAALGGLFAIAFGFVFGRIGGSDPARTALWMAIFGFVVVFLLPFVKYPANPPGTGGGESVGERTELYLLMIAISLAAAVAAARLRRGLRERLAAGPATLIAVGLYLALVLGAMAVMPTVEAIPGDFPSETLQSFRGAAIGAQIVLWTVIGLMFAWGARRVMGKDSYYP